MHTCIDTYIHMCMCACTCTRIMKKYLNWWYKKLQHTTIRYLILHILSSAVSIGDSERLPRRILFDVLKSCSLQENLIFEEENRKGRNLGKMLIVGSEECCSRQKMLHKPC